MPETLDYTTLDYRQWTPAQKLFQWLVRFLVRLLMRLDVDGVEKIPAQGAFILAPNHLHFMDIPVIFVLLNRRTVVFAADKWDKKPIFGWILRNLGNAIFVARGTPDRMALSKALKVLQAGGVLALAPEGTRSPTGGLGKGHTGVAYLATRGSVPILPVVAYGQEQCINYWKRLRRVPVTVRFGDLIELPPGKWRMDELEKQTEQIMITLAQLLPPAYRGIYADSQADNIRA